MIYINIDKPQKLSPTPLSPLSGFVSFDYDTKIIEFIKAMGNRVYIPEKKIWEIPQTAIISLCNKLSMYDIEITGEMVREQSIQVQLPPQFTFKTKPYSHQVEGVLHGIANDNFLLGDDQGLGKTKQIIDLAIARKSIGQIKRCLIICGVNGNKYNWEEEIAIHSNEKSWILGTRYTKRAPIKAFEGGSKEKLADLTNLPDCFFIITNIETLRAMSAKQNKKTIFPIAQKITELCRLGEIGMIAFDEAHKAKNPTSQQGIALLSIDCKYKIPMSGTFLMNNPLDLYLPLKWTGFESHSFYAYKQHYCTMGGFGGQEITGYKNLDELRELLSEVMLRRTKSEVLDLPPKIHLTEYVDMLKDQKTVYDEVKLEIKNEIDKIKVGDNPLAQLIRLRQATGYPGILSSTIIDSAKMQRMEELVRDISSMEEKVIVYSQWEQITSVIREKLKKYNPAYITGDIKSSDRMEQVKKFQQDPTCKVIIGTIGAMGTGLTLTAASNVIFMDSPWNRALKDQAEDRAHRIGTVYPIRVITLVCKDTIDERIEDLVRKKGKMSDMIIDGKMEVQNKSAFVDYLLA